MASCFSSPTYRVAANASRHSVPLRRIFLLHLEFLRVLYLDRSSSPLCVNSLPDVISSSRVLMFTDDTKIFKEIRTLCDASSLQIDLGRLETWSQTSGLAFNEAKCKAQRITRRTKPKMSTYKLNNTLLGTSAAEKDPGV